MANFKCIHFFRDSDSGLGWSEVWYLTAGNYDQAVAQGKSIAISRVRVLAQTNFITHQRITGNQPDNDAARARQPRSSVLDRLDFQGQAKGGPDPQGDWTTTSAKVRWAAADVSIFRVQLLRGVPDDYFAAGSDKVAQASFANWVGKHIDTLQAQGATIRHLAPIVPPAAFRVYTFNTPFRGTYEGYATRQTGRVFNLPRGRAPKRAS